MEPTELPSASTKTPASPSNTIPIRIHKSTAKQLRTIATKCNRKSHGRKVKADDIITTALELLTDDHLEKIKQATYSSSDQLDIEFKNFCKDQGAISKDEFLRFLLSRALPQVPSESRNQNQSKEQT